MTLKEKRDYINVMTKKYKITLEEILDTFDKCEICDMYVAVEFIVYTHELNKVNNDYLEHFNTDSLEEIAKEIEAKFRSFTTDSLKESDTDEK